MRIATWNINSVRIRIKSLIRFIEEYRPDVICLQETKVANDLFPLAAFKACGFDHVAINGQKGYHGVATLSRVPFESPSTRDFCGKADARHQAVSFRGGVTLHNFYVPAGGDIPDPAANDKFAHKLSFLTEMRDWFANGGRPNRKQILVGDLNVAPREHDVWSHKQLLKVVSHTPIEVDHLALLQQSLGWVDLTREQKPEPEKVYTWWSYRAADWEASDRGRRLDHIWVTPGLGGRAGPVRIAREARGWERPSDHVPVILDIDL